MSTGFPLHLIIQAAALAVGLALLGAAWLRWAQPARAIAAVLFGLGVALMLLMSLTLLVYSTSLAHASDRVIVAVLVATVFSYVLCLAGCARFAKVPLRGAILVGVLGLFPLWHFGGYVLISSVCSISPAGC